MSLQILIIGAVRNVESASLVEWMSHALCNENIRQSRTLSDALTHYADLSWIPDLIVVLQSWPDEHTRREVDELSRMAPLSRWVVSYGSWCESDGRTRNLWPQAVRVPWWAAQGRIEREWRLLKGESSIAMPMSSSREEVFGFDHPEFLTSGSKLVLIDSPDSEYRHGLSDLLTASGHSVITFEDFERDFTPHCILFDVDPWGEERQRRLHLLTAKCSNTPTWGLANRPDVDAMQSQGELGLISVFPKLGNHQQILTAISLREPAER